VFFNTADLLKHKMKMKTTASNDMGAIAPNANITSSSVDSEKETYPEATGRELPSATVARITKVSSILTVLVAGIALFSDGYNAQIIGYMEPLFSDL
jgi:hypothetical protein